jgi:hypothetical protein
MDVPMINLPLRRTGPNLYIRWPGVGGRGYLLAVRRGVDCHRFRSEHRCLELDHNERLAQFLEPKLR